MGEHYGQWLQTEIRWSRWLLANFFGIDGLELMSKFHWLDIYNIYKVDPY
jgi:hypothetical protein